MAVAQTQDSDYSQGGIVWRGESAVSYDYATIEDIKTTSGPVNRNGAWSFFGTPEFVARNGTLFGGYVDEDGVVKAISSDLDTGEKREQNLHARDVDGHENPTVLIRNSDDRVIYFWGRGAALEWKISDNPLAVNGFGPTNETAGGVSYASPIQLGAESDTIYVFFREDFQKLSYLTSTDGAASFSASQTLLDHTGDDRSYFQVEKEGTDTIHITWNPTGGNPDSVYYLRYTADEFFYRQ